MQSFSKSLYRARKVVQKAGSLNSAGSVSILTFFRGRKGHPFVSVLREEPCVGLMMSACLKHKNLMGYAREELWLSFPVYSFLGTWFIIAWLELGCPIRQKAGSALELGLKYTWSLKKRKLKWHLKSEVQLDNLSFHTHWAGLATTSLIANKHSNTLASSHFGLLE